MGQPVAKLPKEPSDYKSCGLTIASYHARARKDVPAEPDTVTVLYLTPLIFQRLIVHIDQAEPKRRSPKWPNLFSIPLSVHHNIGRLLKQEVAIKLEGPRRFCGS